MTIQDIRDRLGKWKKDAIYPNSKSFRELASPIITGEYYFILEQKFNPVFLGVSIPISYTRTFHTQTFSENPLSNNHSSDLYRLEKILPNLDYEFIQKVEEAITEGIKKINPEGFF